MNRTVERYLERRTQSAQWPLEGDPYGPSRSIVVIPALGEYPGVMETLADLAACPESLDTLVIVVVNNRHPDAASAEDISLNRQTLEALQKWDSDRLRVTWVDASSPGLELPEKEGVGLARKLGLDAGLQILADLDQLQTPLVCLDGDTRVDDDYLPALHRFFESPDRWAAILSYAHPIEGDPQQQAAILCYEFFLRYHAAHLTWAGSPYGYHAIGSAMACTGQAYAAISGMNRRQAGEDFYFLQQLAKTGSVDLVEGTTVRPSGRPSHRVPFGTGRRVQRFLDGEEHEYSLYHPASYEIIRQWLQVAEGAPGTGEQLLATAERIEPQLQSFLVGQKLAPAWDRMCQQSPTPDALRAQFHEWFDGFRTLKCIHYLRDSIHADVPMFDAIDALLERVEEVPAVEPNDSLVNDLEGQKQLLAQLRQL